jgi:hypothetical protein
MAIYIDVSYSIKSILRLIIGDRTLKIGRIIIKVIIGMGETDAAIIETGRKPADISRSLLN